MRKAPNIVRVAPAAGAGVSALPFIARLPRFIGAAADAARRLDAATVVIIGCGSVGRRVALHATRLGVGRLLVVDPKSYKPESLVTQPVLRSEIGTAKARATARLCRRINPRLDISHLVGPVEALLAADLDPVTFGVVATDNLAAEFTAGQLFIQLGRPLFHASVHGATLTAQVRVFGNASADDPCPACQFGEEEWRLFHEGTRFSCEGASSDSAAAGAVETPPTMAPASLCSLAADLCITLALRHVLGLGAPVVNTWHSFNGYTMQTRSVPLARNPMCPCAHVPLVRLTAVRKLGECSLRELAGLAVPGAPEFSAHVAGHLWHEAAVCSCQSPPRIRRFHPTATRIRGRCRACGEPRRAAPVFSHRDVSSFLVGPALDLPLRQLGAPAPRWVCFSTEGRAAVVMPPGVNSVAAISP